MVPKDKGAGFPEVFADVDTMGNPAFSIAPILREDRVAGTVTDSLFSLHSKKIVTCEYKQLIYKSELTKSNYYEKKNYPVILL
jgi:hypothetical protein